MRLDDDVYNVLDVKLPERIITLKGKIESLNYFDGTVKLYGSVVGSELLPDGFDRDRFDSVEVFFHCQNFALASDGKDKAEAMRYTALKAFEVDDEVIVLFYPGERPGSADNNDFLYVFGVFGSESPPLCKRDLMFVSLSSPRLTRGDIVYRDSITIIDCYDIDNMKRLDPPTDFAGNPLFSFPVLASNENYKEWAAENVSSHGITVPEINGSELIGKTDFYFCVYGHPVEGETSSNTPPYPYYTDPFNPIVYHSSPQDISVAGIRSGDPIYGDPCDPDETYVKLDEKSISGYEVRDNGSTVLWSESWPPPDYSYTSTSQLLFSGNDCIKDLVEVYLDDIAAEYATYKLEVNETDSTMPLLEHTGWCVASGNSPCDSYPSEPGNIDDYLPYYDATTYKKFLQTKKREDSHDSALFSCSWVFYNDEYNREGVFRVSRAFLVEESSNETSKRPVLEYRELGNDISTLGCPYYGPGMAWCSTTPSSPQYEYVTLIEQEPQTCEIKCYSMFNNVTPWKTVELTSFSHETLVASKDYMYEHGGYFDETRYTSLIDDLLARPLMAGGFISVGTNGVYSFELLVTFYGVSEYDPVEGIYSFNFENYDAYSRQYLARYSDLHQIGVNDFSDFTFENFTQAANGEGWIEPLFLNLVSAYKDIALDPIKDIVFDSRFPMVSNEDVQPVIDVSIKTTKSCPYSEEH